MRRAGNLATFVCRLYRDSGSLSLHYLLKQRFIYYMHDLLCSGPCSLTTNYIYMCFVWLSEWKRLFSYGNSIVFCEVGSVFLSNWDVFLDSVQISLVSSRSCPYADCPYPHITRHSHISSRTPNRFHQLKVDCAACVDCWITQLCGTVRRHA